MTIATECLIQTPGKGWISAGWYAFDHPPAVGDRLVLNGMAYTEVVASRTWEHKEVAPAGSMIEAGLSDKRAPYAKRWVCTLHLERLGGLERDAE